MPASTVIAVDVGGTSIKAALIDDTGATVGGQDLATPVTEGPDAVVGAVRAVVRELAGPGVAAVGVVVPGIVDVSTGTARYSANLGWRDVPLGKLVAADVGVPVAVDHDVRAAGYADRVLGLSREVADCLVVVIGTGIAGVVVSGGAPVRGATDLAGEIGHIPVHPEGDLCACGQHGCTESYASAAAISRRYLALTGRRRTAAEIVAERAVDPVAAQVWDDATSALGLALTTYTMLLDPSLVVLAGGLSAAGAALRDPVRDVLASRLVWRPAPAVEISPLGGRAGQFGAALYAWRAAGRELGADWQLG